MMVERERGCGGRGVDEGSSVMVMEKVRSGEGKKLGDNGKGGEME